MDASGRLLPLFIQSFGAAGTVWLMAGVVTVLGARRLYMDWRTDRHIKRLLKEKERTIQRIANQEREWRIYFVMRDHGMTLEEAQALIAQNNYSTPQESREHLEGQRA